VPRLRELAALEHADGVPLKPTWRACHAVLFVGCMTAVVGAVVAGLLSRFDGGASQRLPDEAMIRTAIDAADVVPIYKAWLAVKESGVDRGAVPEEIFVQHVARSVGGVAMLIWMVAGVGAMAAIAGGLACLRPQRGTGGPAG
jgi:hypothetical protein